MHHFLRNAKRNLPGAMYRGDPHISVNWNRPLSNAPSNGISLARPKSNILISPRYPEGKGSETRQKKVRASFGN